MVGEGRGGGGGEASPLTHQFPPKNFTFINDVIQKMVTN